MFVSAGDFDISTKNNAFIMRKRQHNKAIVLSTTQLNLVDEQDKKFPYVLRFSFIQNKHRILCFEQKN